MAVHAAGLLVRDESDCYFAKPLPQDDDIEFSHLSYLSSRIGAAILACRHAPESATGIEVALLVNLINSISTAGDRRLLGGYRGVRLAEARIKALGGRNSMADAPSLKALRSQMRRNEHAVYLVGLMVRAILLLRKYRVPSWSLENARALIAQTYKPVTIRRAADLGGDFVLGIRDDETLRGIWTKYRKIASYCFVACNHQVALAPLIESGGYGSAAAFACQARRVQLHLRKALTAHAPGQQREVEAGRANHRHYALSQILPFNSLTLGSEDGRQNRSAIRPALQPTAAESEFIDRLKRNGPSVGAR